jgi:UDP-glucose 4-epimerase
VGEGRIDFWGDGSEIREYVHITDASGLAVDALASEHAGQSLHIAGRERVSTRELVDMINEMLGGNLSVTMRDEPFEGRYRITPYAFESDAGRRITCETYVDLGLGILEALREVDRDRGIR